MRPFSVGLVDTASLRSRALADVLLRMDARILFAG